MDNEQAKHRQHIRDAHDRLHAAAAATATAAGSLTAAQLEAFGVDVPAAAGELASACRTSETAAVEAAARGLAEAVTLEVNAVPAGRNPEAVAMTCVVWLRACVKALDAARIAAE